MDHLKLRDQTKPVSWSNRIVVHQQKEQTGAVENRLSTT